jgi:hypothetical protein
MKKEYFECNCGNEILRVQSETYFVGKNQFSQEYYFAIFSHKHDKPSIWNRIIIACKFILTGKIYADQIILSTDEANKLTQFISKNLINHEKH